MFGQTESNARLNRLNPSCVRCRKDRNSGGEEEGERGAWGRNGLYFTIRVLCFHQNVGLCSDASSVAVPLTANGKDNNAVSIKHILFKCVVNRCRKVTRPSCRANALITTGANRFAAGDVCGFDVQ